MASDGDSFQTPRRPFKKGPSRTDKRPHRPYSPRPPSSGKYHRPAYKPSVSPVRSAVEDDCSPETLPTETRRTPLLGLLECSYKLNYSDTKRVTIGVDLAEDCFPFITIGKVGGLCVKLNYSEWCDLLKCESEVGSYFSGVAIPHKIAFGRYVLKFRTVFGAKSIVLESPDHCDDKSGVYLARTSWNGLFNIAECVRLRWNERNEWSTCASKIVDLQLDSIFNTLKREVENGEILNNIPREIVNRSSFNPDDIGSTPKTLNVNALLEEICSTLRTHDGENFIKKEMLLRDDKILG